MNGKIDDQIKSIELKVKKYCSMHHITAEFIRDWEYGPEHYILKTTLRVLACDGPTIVHQEPVTWFDHLLSDLGTIHPLIKMVCRRVFKGRPRVRRYEYTPSTLCPSIPADVEKKPVHVLIPSRTFSYQEGGEDDPSNDYQLDNGKYGL